MDGASLGKKSYFDQVMAWGRRDDARRARERAAQERRERRQQEREQQRQQRNADGDRWKQGSMRYTVNSTSDPGAPGGYYVSIQDDDDPSLGHATAVYNADGTFADVKANNQWDDIR